ncbi:MAG: HAD family phosphatase [Bacilli bacterium]|nr:HAD family phosphatase [Bacilli bacterium]
MTILASDFDDTMFYLDNTELNNKNAEAIRNFVRHGNSFCIITGRQYTDLKKELTSYDIPYTYLICEDGAKIFNGVDYCLDTILLERKDIEMIVPIIEEHKWDYYLDDGYNETTNYDDCVKIVIRCDNSEKQKEIVEIIQSKVPVHVYASRSHINIINKTVSKEKALKRLFNLEKLNYNALKVIGDNYNDYGMIKEFNGVVMKKHHQILDSLQKKEYETLSDYIEELMNS